MQLASVTDKNVIWTTPDSAWTRRAGTYYTLRKLVICSRNQLFHSGSVLGHVNTCRFRRYGSSSYIRLHNSKDPVVVLNSAPTYICSKPMQFADLNRTTTMYTLRIVSTSVDGYQSVTSSSIWDVHGHEIHMWCNFLSTVDSVNGTLIKPYL